MKVSKAEIICRRSTSSAACGWGRRLGTSSCWNNPSEEEDAREAGLEKQSEKNKCFIRFTTRRQSETSQAQLGRSLRFQPTRTTQPGDRHPSPQPGLGKRCSSSQRDKAAAGQPVPSSSLCCPECPVHTGTTARGPQRLPRALRET